MGWFNRKKMENGPNYYMGRPLPDWSRDPIVSQSVNASTPPRVGEEVIKVIERVGRGDSMKAIQATWTVLESDTDRMRAQTPELEKYDFNEIRGQLIQRPDRNEAMLFTYLTYFGVPGIAMHNVLIDDTLPKLLEIVEERALEGELD